MFGLAGLTGLQNAGEHKDENTPEHTNTEAPEHTNAHTHTHTLTLFRHLPICPQIIQLTCNS